MKIQNIEIVKIKSVSDLQKNLITSQDIGYFLFFISGEGIVYVDNYKLNLKSNIVINIIANSEIRIDINEHKIDAIIIKYSQEIKEILALHSLRLFCPVTGALKISPKKSVFLDMLFYLKKIKSQIEDITNTNSELIFLNLIIIVKELSKEIGLENTNRRINNKTILGFINLLDANYQNNKNLDFYTEKLLISNKTLYRTFKDNLDISPKEFVNYRVSMEAKKMMLHSNLSVKEISSKLGFQSQYNFTNFFKTNNNNLSPTKYKLVMSENHIILS